MRARDQRLAHLRQTIQEADPTAARALQQAGAVLIDVREPDETAQGMPQGAVPIVRGFLELRIEESVPQLDQTVLVLCAGGVRSLFACEDLLRLGYTDVRSVAGGFSLWKAQGLPVTVPRALTPEQRERYGRHCRIPEVGEAGQLRLLDSKVLVIGAGGLGSPAAFYLAAAGVGTLGLVDDDVVDRSNLQRQILHTEDRVGTPKVESALTTLRALNPSLRYVGHSVRLTVDTAAQLIGDYDLVVDGTDNFATRYLINDACITLGRPLIYGAVMRFEGQVSVFWPGFPARRGPCYRCLFPEAPPPGAAPSCAEAGVLGVLPGIIGTLMAAEALKVLLGVGEPLVGRLMLYDALQGEFRTFKVARDPRCRWCGDHAQPPPLGEGLPGQVCAAGGGR